MVTHWKTFFATVVIFGAGVAAGALIVATSQKVEARSVPTVAPAIPGPVNQRPVLLRLELLKRMRKELDLSPEQRTSIERMLRESQERTRPILEEVNPRLRAEMRNLREQMRNELSPEQREKFERLLRNRPGPHGEAGDRRRRVNPVAGSSQ